MAAVQRGGVLVFDQRERYARTIGHEDFRPVGLAVHADRLYVCNLASQVVEVFDRHSGARLGTIGGIGDEDGQFRVPLGIDTDGVKHPLGLWDGSTENAHVCQEQLANLQSRGVRTDRSLLVILDGSKALRKPTGPH